MLDNLFHLSAADITSSSSERVAEGRARTARLKERIDTLLDTEDVIALKLPKGTGHWLIDSLGLTGQALGDMMTILTQKLVDGEITLESNFAHEASKVMLADMETWNPGRLAKIKETDPERYVKIMETQKKDA